MATSVVACAAAPTEEKNAVDEPAGRVQMAIQGGAPDPTSTHVLALYNTKFESRCTAVLIAPNLALATRHCVDVTSPNVDCSTKFEVSVRDTELLLSACADMTNLSACDWHRSAQIYRPSADEFCSNDIVIVRLDNPFTIAPAPPALEPLTLEGAPPFDVVGYGADGPSLTSAGIRRSLHNLRVSCLGETCERSAYGAPVGRREFVSTEKGVCEGDSGAPALARGADGQPRVIGIVSRVGYTATECVGSIYTRLDSWKDFVGTAGRSAARAGQYPTPEWAKLPMGGACTAAEDCGSALCENVDGRQLCTKRCTNGAGCEAGFECGTGELCAPAANAEPPVRLSDGCLIGYAVGANASRGEGRLARVLFVLAMATTALARRRARTS